MARRWTLLTALEYCAKAEKQNVKGLKYWSARDYLDKRVQQYKEVVKTEVQNTQEVKEV